MAVWCLLTAVLSLMSFLLLHERLTALCAALRARRECRHLDREWGRCSARWRVQFLRPPER